MRLILLSFPETLASLRRFRMKLQLTRLGLTLACALGVAPRLPAQIRADERALAAEARMVEAMGGRRAWESARFFDFVWAVERPGRPPTERRHVWDRWTGRYKLEMPLRDGRHMVAIFNANTKAGDVWIDNSKLTGDSVQTLLDRAYAVHINDSYWLIMPFKWLDPGVNLEYLGLVTDSTGKQWEKIQLTFENVGLTPDNRYHAYLDPETWLMGWWEHFRQRADSIPGVRCQWLAWEQRGPIKVSLDRPFLGGGARIYFPQAVIATEVDESAFAPPSP
ncbi:MAG: hypothetical protein GTN62_08640 [Gemmatimonadales bacterium]|nr:hypothetical protein [Gemmatimonadales bacterium]NIN50164.1 hypothetical protein [Gemmatimonadales bacterium]NIP07628.1 hypothetical protein [Gemmatimonadales bacterium]NIR01780.1 hypothetical protein [Gemmatimonadales bacterium]NIS65683.1 hypothetical protein [Gemmatimonadales bacterium]